MNLFRLFLHKLAHLLGWNYGTMTFIQVWDVDEAVDELKELLGNIGIFPELNKFIESGKSAFIIREIDSSETELTGKFFVTYQLADELKALLKTVRANKVNSQIS